MLTVFLFSHLARLEEWVTTTAEREVTLDGKISFKPELELIDFLNGRENLVAFKLLLSKFMPAMTRKVLWRHVVINAQTEEDLATVSTEAFLLLVLENNWDRWLDKYNNLYGSGGSTQTTTENLKSTLVSKVPTKYTCSGNMPRLNSPNEATLGKGWSNKGKIRYNELYERVKQDRKHFPEAFGKWISEERVRLGSTSKVNKEVASQVVRTKNELFSDSEGEENDQKDQGSQKRRRYQREYSTIAEHLQNLGDDIVKPDSVEV